MEATTHRDRTLVCGVGPASPGTLAKDRSLGQVLPKLALLLPTLPLWSRTPPNLTGPEGTTAVAGKPHTASGQRVSLGLGALVPRRDTQAPLGTRLQLAEQGSGPTGQGPSGPGTRAPLPPSLDDEACS